MKKVQEEMEAQQRILDEQAQRRIFDTTYSGYCA
jgi:hypothetical protein